MGMEQRKLLMKKQITEFRKFMYARHVPKHIGRQVQMYIHALYPDKGGFDEQEVIRSLPPTLADHLLLHMYRALLEHGALKNIRTNHTVIGEIGRLMKPYHAMEDVPIFEPGQSGQQLFIIVSDAKVVISFDRHEFETEDIKYQGDMFGEACLSTYFNPREDHQEHKYTRKAVATTDCELRYLTDEDVREVCNGHADMRSELWRLHRKERRQLDMRKFERIALPDTLP